MVDLKGQYLKIKSEIDTEIHKVLDSTAFINGSIISDFSRNLEKHLGVKHVIPCANGTDAIQIALMALGLKPGDEVITTDFTFVATVEVVALLGLKLKFADAVPGTFNIDADKIEELITPATKAIVPVHLFGQGADMEKIMKIADKHKLFVVEDTAQAIGGTYTFDNGNKKMLGTIGQIGTTSFFPSKNLGCYGDGGAVITNDDSLAEKCRQILNHGSKVKYYHDVVGINSRLDTIQAAVLFVKLKYLNDYQQARQKAAAYYDNALKDSKHFIIPERNKKSEHVFHQYTLKLNGIDRNDLQNYLKEKGIPSMVYYPVSLHLQKAYLNLGYKENDFPVTEELSDIVLSLPMHTELTENQLEYITKTLLDYAK